MAEYNQFIIITTKGSSFFCLLLKSLRGGELKANLHFPPLTASLIFASPIPPVQYFNLSRVSYTLV